MAPESDAQDRRELQFFGSAMAVVSHDLKNMLSIIGESAGLLQDLVAMSQSTGRQPDLEKLDAIAARIQKNTLRADAIVKRMNGFSHSVDHDRQNVDLHQAARLVAEMGERRWNRTAVTVTVAEAALPVAIVADMFEILRVLWLCLELCCEHADRHRGVTIHVEAPDGVPTISFSGLETGDGIGAPNPTRPEFETLAALVPATMDLVQEEQALTLRMPTVTRTIPPVDAEKRGN